MGCSSSQTKGNESASVQANRCRLSVGNDPDGEGEGRHDVEEIEKGLIMELDQQSIIEMLATSHGSGDRKMSISSMTDMTDEGQVSFANKTTTQLGDKLNPTENCCGYTCRKGLKPENPNQDSWFLLTVEGGFSMYAVFDGHGKKGHDVSNFVKENLPKLVIRDPKFRTDDMRSMFVDVFKKTQSLVSTADHMQKLSAQHSGTTATLVVHDHKANKLTVSHVADSSAVLGRYKDADRKVLEAVSLTRDHKPNLKDEEARIQSMGGEVVFDGYANHRVWAKNARYPGLNMSRCLGDLLGHQDCGLIAEPEVSTRTLSNEDSVLLVCSDGVWEFITPMEAVNIVSGFTPDKAMLAAETLAKEAWDRWITEAGGVVVDDITVVLVFLNTASVSVARP